MNIIFFLNNAFYSTQVEFKYFLLIKTKMKKKVHILILFIQNFKKEGGGKAKGVMNSFKLNFVYF